MSDNEKPFSSKNENTQMRLSGLLCGIELQMRLMETIKIQLENYISNEAGNCDSSMEDSSSMYTCAEKSTYGTESYMADYVLDEYGAVKDIRFDWVKGL